MKLTQIVELKPEELHAMKILSEISCTGVVCIRCPFYKDGPCVLNEIKDIYLREDLKWHEKQH